MRFSFKQVVHPGVRARDLPALMELYELNYIQLRRLIPDIAAFPDQGVSSGNDKLDLHLSIIERSRYTTTLYLTYQFDDKAGLHVAPDVVVRMYHDAQLAEVISRGRRGVHRDGVYDRVHHRYPIETKWKANRFLQKWLGFCLHHGHRFAAGASALSDALPVAGDEPALSVES
jgi:uncharacterized protein